MLYGKLRNVLIFGLLLLFPVIAAAQESITKNDILSRVEGMSGLKVKNVTLELKFRQPVDHNNPAAGSFEQRFILLHKDFNKPVVLWLEGYSIWRNGEQELTKLLDANQIVVEHRYFGESKPDSLDWQYLTIEQAAADDHRIVETFKKIYPGKWVNSGISKGGQTVMYHRRFYPHDVDASVCYVAPLNFSDKDPRIYAHFKTVGNEQCRNKIYDFQKFLLRNKDRIMPFFKEYSSKKNYTYKIGEVAAFEYCVLEYPFAFWQWHKYDCSEIPSDSSCLKEIFDHFTAVSSPDYFSDQGIADLQPFFYQALTQIGYYGYETKPFTGLIDSVKEADFRFCAPKGTNPVFDPQAMQDINQWITTKGDNMIFIYGELDPWGATGVELNGKTNALKMVKKGGCHSTRIKDFSQEEQNKIIKTLNKWLEIGDGN